MEYTNEQKEKITKMFEISKKIIPQRKNICALGMKVTYEDNTTEKIGNHELILNNKNRFKNWKCKICNDKRNLEFSAGRNGSSPSINPSSSRSSFYSSKTPILQI